MVSGPAIRSLSSLRPRLLLREFYRASRLPPYPEVIVPWSCYSSSPRLKFSADFLAHRCSPLFLGIPFSESPSIERGPKSTTLVLLFPSSQAVPLIYRSRPSSSHILPFLLSSIRERLPLAPSGPSFLLARCHPLSRGTTTRVPVFRCDSRNTSNVSSLPHFSLL